jgi:uroporphyrinogen decarboxylase
MNPRQRILAALRRQPLDRLPVDLWYTPEVFAALRAHTGAADELALCQALSLDKIVWVFMNYRSESGLAGGQAGAGAESERSAWGVALRETKAGAATYHEVAEAPLAALETTAELDRYAGWPDPGRFDYDDALARARAASPSYAVIGPWVSFFEIYCQMRGLEQAMMDLALDPDFVDAALDRIEAIQTVMMERFFVDARGHLDLCFVSDDIAGQTSLLMSPASWRRHLAPRLRRWCELIHRHDLKVFYHTDGAAGPLVGPLIECGIDVLNPIQHVCPGMDRAWLKREFGQHVIFHGGVDNQSVLPFGSPDDVRRETKRCLETLGAGGEGFICSSCHNVQAGTPVENILAMIETVLQHPL